MGILSDEKLIAYLDGELSEYERAEIERDLDRDPGLRHRAQRLSETAALLRAAYDEVMREPLPPRLLVAARGERQRPSTTARVKRMLFGQRARWIGIPIAASLVGILLGATLTYIAADQHRQTATHQAQANVGLWLDNIAGYHKLFVKSELDDAPVVDVPAKNDGGAHITSRRLPAGLRVPNLDHWGLIFQGARFLIIEGRPATQLFYKTDNQTLGPLTIVVANSDKPDLAMRTEHRQDLDLVYWRRYGHAYAVTAEGEVGNLRKVANEIAAQLDRI